MSSNTTVGGWSACFNASDDTIAVSCTITGEAITAAGLIVNTGDGKTLASCYTEISGGCSSASPSLNLAPNGLKVGDTLLLAADGQADGQHFFVEEKVPIGTC